jgi:hypothetical protein
VLASILPGVRDVRAPLASGYIWLLSLYLALEPIVPKKPHGIWASVDHLRHMFSLVATGLAVSFVAYLVGSISVSVFGYLALLSRPVESDPDYVRRLMRSGSTFGSIELALSVGVAGVGSALAMPSVIPLTEWRDRRNRGLGPYGEFARAALVDTVRARISALADALEGLPESEFGPWRSLAGAAEGIRAANRDVGKKGGTSGPDERTPSGEPIGESPPESLRRALRPVEELLVTPSEESRPTTTSGTLARDEAETLLAVVIIRDLRLARLSLIGQEPEVFSEIDRLQSEADFRYAVAPPLVGFAAVLAWRATWWSAVIALIGAILLFISGRAQTRRSNDALLEALRLGRAQTPSLDLVNDAIERLRKLQPTAEDDRTIEANAAPIPTNAR